MRTDIRGLADGSIELIESGWIGGPNDGDGDKPIPFDFTRGDLTLTFSEEPWKPEPGWVPIDMGTFIIRRELITNEETPT